MMKIEFINFLPDDPSRDFVYPMLAIPIVAALTTDDFAIEMTFLRKNEHFTIKDVDVVAMSILTHSAPYAYKIANAYKAKGKKVIMGGIHPSVLPNEALVYADSVVVGEAELVWISVLEDLKYNQLKKMYKAKNFVPMKEIPRSRIDLMNSDKFNTISVIHATRGCPFDCSFCSVTNFFGRTYRFRPIKSIIDEVIFQLESNICKDRHIIFNDDNIACNKKFAEELFGELKKLDITWSSQANLSLGNDENLIKLAADSGCISLFVGIESVIEKNLKAVDKTMNSISNYEDAIKRIHDNGISIIGSFVFGLDNDTEDVFDKTLDFIINNKIELPTLSVLTPYPGTRIFKELKSQNRILDFNWEKYDMSNVVYLPKLSSPEKLQEKFNEINAAVAFRKSRGAKKFKNSILAKQSKYI